MTPFEPSYMPNMMGGGNGGPNPGIGQMDPASLQSMLQIYQTLQPSGQLAQQMQAAHVPGLLSRF